MAIATCWRDLLQDWTRLLSCLRAWQPWMPGGGTAFSPGEKRHRTPARQSFIQWSSHVPGLSGRLLPQVWLLARAVLADPGCSLVWPYTSTATLPSSAPIHFAHRYQGAADNVASSMATLELWLLSSTYTCLRIQRSIGRNLEKSHFLFNTDCSHQLLPMNLNETTSTQNVCVKLQTWSAQRHWLLHLP